MPGEEPGPGAGDTLTIASVVRTAVWRETCIDSETGAPATDPRFRALSRDRFTCAGCGVTSSPVPADLWGGMQVHHLDDNPLNNHPGNLVCVCPVCHRLLHFDLAFAAGALPGRLVWLPDVPQHLVTLVCHTAAVAEVFWEHMQEPQEEPEPARSGKRGRAAASSASSESSSAGSPSSAQAGRSARASARAVSARLAEPDPVSLTDPAVAGVWKIVSRTRALWRLFADMRLPRGVLISPHGLDLAPLLDGRPQLFGTACGKILRAGLSPAGRARLARCLAPLRFVPDLRQHPAARIWAASVLWHQDGRWVETWTNAAAHITNIVRRQDAARRAGRPVPSPEECLNGTSEANRANGPGGADGPDGSVPPDGAGTFSGCDAFCGSNAPFGSDAPSDADAADCASRAAWPDHDPHDPPYSPASPDLDGSPDSLPDTETAPQRRCGRPRAPARREMPEGARPAGPRQGKAPPRGRAQPAARPAAAEPA